MNDLSSHGRNNHIFSPRARPETTQTKKAVLTLNHNQYLNITKTPHPTTIIKK